MPKIIKSIIVFNISILFFLVAYLVKCKICNEIPFVAKQAVMQITSESMYPYLQAGDNVSVKKVNLNSLQTNEIYVYKKQDIYIIHRLIEIEETEKGLVYIFQGDNNSQPDEPLEDSRLIVGEYVKKTTRVSSWANVILISSGLTIILCFFLLEKKKIS